jgi:hypothetical protein
MNSRHAAVLALVGWYLMLPNLVEKTPHRWNLCCYHSNGSPDLHSWERMASYDTAKQCEHAKRELVAPDDPAASASDPAGLEAMSDKSWAAALCIEADAPHLKEK